ncbi:MAG TPA: hypothetical protein VNO79_11940 [Actinomycetota bacterium]|nr:hypothetical protein [Actinomycetota bacterium]
MTTTRRRRTPSRGERFKRAVLERFELDPAELELLDEAAATLDLIERLEDPRELRLQRDVLRRLVAALNLEGGETSSEVRAKARRAARARWARVVPGPWEGPADG